MIRVIMLLLSLTILVTLHEMGHYLPARWFDTKVKKFYLFFDFFFLFPNVLPYALVRILYGQEKTGMDFFKNKAAITFYRTSVSKTDTEYGLGYFPLGGYVQIDGMVDETQSADDMPSEPQPWEFRSKKAWQRLIIMIGGVTVNFLLGGIIFAMMLWTYGKEYLPNQNVKYGIYADSTAQYIGFKTGDKILSVGNKPFDKFNPRSILQDIVINNTNTAEVERNGVRTAINFAQNAHLDNPAVKDILFISPRFPFSIKAINNGPAKEAGLQAGDAIVGLNGKAISYYDEFTEAMKTLKNQAIELKVLRNQDTTIFKMTTTPEGKIGIQADADMSKHFDVKREKYGFFESIPMGFGEGLGFIGNQLKAFGQMFKGKVSTDNIGSVGTMAQMFPETWDWEAFWRMTGVLSFVLAVMNLLPVPGLDGGYVIFLLWEMITGKKPSDKFLEKANSIGVFLLLGLMVFGIKNDIQRLSGIDFSFIGKLFGK